MTVYVLRRLLQLVPTLLLASAVVFAIIQSAPGDPAFMMLGPEATQDQLRAERERLGLDKPLPVRYAVWLGDVARLNFGVSQTNRRPVAQLVAEAFPNTIKLALVSFALAVAVGLPLGLVAATRQEGLLDAAITSVNALGLAIPTFWLGMLLILLFSVSLRWLPPSGAGDPNAPPLDNLKYLILPVLTISVSNLSVFARFTRSALLDVLSADYIRTARAKGLPEGAVLTRHAVRNALIPIVTILGIQFGRLLGGAVVTEAVFAYPGVGRLVVGSILNRDYPTVQAALLLVVAIFLVTNILVDLTYTAIDPRVKLAGQPS